MSILIMADELRSLVRRPVRAGHSPAETEQKLKTRHGWCER